MQAVLSGGLVFLAVFAERFFGFRLGRRQWAGVIVTAAGLAIIGLTTGSDDDPPGYALAALIAIECGVLVVGTAVAAISTHRRIRSRHKVCSSGRPPARCSASPT